MGRGRHIHVRERIVLGFRAKQVLDLIRDCAANDQRVPSYDEIADELGFSDRSRVAHCVAGLERQGYIRRMGLTGRGHRRIVLLRAS